MAVDDTGSLGACRSYARSGSLRLLSTRPDRGHPRVDRDVGPRRRLAARRALRRGHLRPHAGADRGAGSSGASHHQSKLTPHLAPSRRDRKRCGRARRQPSACSRTAPTDLRSSPPSRHGRSRQGLAPKIAAAHLCSLCPRAGSRATGEWRAAPRARHAPR